jgi:hypothetical protein
MAAARGGTRKAPIDKALIAAKGLLDLGWGWRAVTEATGIQKDRLRRRLNEAGMLDQNPTPRRGGLITARKAGAEKAYKHMDLLIGGGSSVGGERPPGASPLNRPSAPRDTSTVRGGGHDAQGRARNGIPGAVRRARPAGEPLGHAAPLGNGRLQASDADDVPGESLLCSFVPHLRGKRVSGHINKVLFDELLSRGHSHAKGTTEVSNECAKRQLRSWGFVERQTVRFYGKVMVTYVLDLQASPRVDPVSRHPSL